MDRLPVKRTQLIMEEGRKRGFTFKEINYDETIYMAEKDGKGFIFQRVPGLLEIKHRFARQKGVAAGGVRNFEQLIEKPTMKPQMAAVDMPHPKNQGVFTSIEELAEAELTYPVVAKPVHGTFSGDVFVNLNTKEAMLKAAKVILETGQNVLIEEYAVGIDYRLIVANGKYCGTVERRPANVTGDGTHTIQQLVTERNDESGRGSADEPSVTVHYLVLNEETDQLLADKGYTLESIPAQGERVYVQRKISASLGSDYIDVTNEVHQSYIEPCLRLLNHLQVPMLGMDLITSDITKPIDEVGGVFNEYNLGAYIDLVENCNIGQKHPVATHIWDYVEDRYDEIVTQHFLSF